MSQIIDQAESLRQQAIGILMAERQIIDQKLAMLGANGTEATTIKKIKACSICSSESHNARTCPNKKGGAAAPLNPST